LCLVFSQFKTGRTRATTICSPDSFFCFLGQEGPACLTDLQRAKEEKANDLAFPGCRTKLSVHFLVAYAPQSDGLRAVVGIVSEPQVGRQCSRVGWGKSHVNDTASARIERSGGWAAGGA